jgi:hypothetical protein
MREQGFAIERADDNTGFKQIAQVGANVLTYSQGQAVLFIEEKGPALGFLNEPI